MYSGIVFYDSAGFHDSDSCCLYAMVVITIGERIIIPVIQTIIANIALEDIRARYMTALHVSWGIASAFGPLAAGIILDIHDTNSVWHASAII